MVQNLSVRLRSCLLERAQSSSMRRAAARLRTLESHLHSCLIVLAMIYTVGDISGAHLNPAVSVGFFAAQRFPLQEVVPYVLNQCAGAFAASFILRFLFTQNATLGATQPAGSPTQSFFLELILTA